MKTIEPYIFLAGTIITTVYAQLMIKWRVSEMGLFPENWNQRIAFFAGALTDPMMISAFLAAFLSAVFWIAAMTHFQISYAYPIVVGSLILITVSLSIILLGETITAMKALGIILIVSGLVLVLKN